MKPIYGEGNFVFIEFKNIQTKTDLISYLKNS